MIESTLPVGQCFFSGLTTILPCYPGYLLEIVDVGCLLNKNIPFLVGHEPFIGKFLNIFYGYNQFKLSRQVQR